MLVAHASGRTALVQGSAGFVPARSTEPEADVVYLGVGQLGIQSEDYIRTYWAETVTAVGARRVVLIHWDDFFRGLDQPLRALPFMGDDLDVTMRVFEELATSSRSRCTSRRSSGARTPGPGWAERQASSARVSSTQSATNALMCGMWSRPTCSAAPSSTVKIRSSRFGLLTAWS